MATSNLANRPARTHRRQLTLLFCDLVGSTSMSMRLDPEDLQEVLTRYRTAVIRAVHRYDGHVAQYFGDGILAYFGYPAAIEDAARRAVLAGLDLTTDIAQSQPNIAVRVGIHTGATVVNERSKPETGPTPEAIGATPNIAARLQGVAPLNGVVTSGETFRLCRRFFDFQPIDVGSFGAGAGSHTVYVVKRERSTPIAVDSTLVGRDRELQRIVEYVADVRNRRGRGAVVIRGEAGVGKSALMNAALTKLGLDYAPFRAHCTSYDETSALRPITRLIASVADLTPDMNSIDVLHALARTVRQRGLSESEASALIDRYVGRRQPSSGLHEASESHDDALFAYAMLRFLSCEAGRTPLLIVEDLHWADHATRRFIDSLYAAADATPIVVVVTARPSPVVPFADRDGVLRTDLGPLAAQHIDAIIDNVTGGSLDRDGKSAIAAKTSGLPLFAEELARFVTSGPATIDIPTTLHDMLAARLDRLRTGRWTVQLAAVIGAQFSKRLLVAMDEDRHESVDAALRELIFEGIVRPVADERDAFEFRHELLRDAAYERLAKGDRRHLHQRLGNLYEAGEFDVSVAQPALLARHFGLAGDPLKAGSYWVRAGQMAVARSAYVDAVRNFQDASRCFDQLLRLDAEDHEAQVGKARALNELVRATLLHGEGGDVDTALAAADQAVDSALRGHPSHADALVEKARLFENYASIYSIRLRHADEYAALGKARDACDAVLTVTPSNRTAVRLRMSVLGDLARLAGDYVDLYASETLLREAADASTTAMAGEPHDIELLLIHADILRGLGHCLRYLRRFGEATDAFLRASAANCHAVELRDGDARLHFHAARSLTSLALTYTESGAHHESVNACTSALHACNQALGLTEDFEHARRLRVRCLTLLATARCALSDFPGALAALDDALEAYGRLSASYQASASGLQARSGVSYVTGEVFRRRGETRRAIDAYTEARRWCADAEHAGAEATEIAPFDTWIFLRLGEAYRELDLPGLAAKSLVAGFSAVKRGLRVSRDQFVAEGARVLLLLEAANVRQAQGRMGAAARLAAAAARCSDEQVSFVPYSSEAHINQAAVLAVQAKLLSACGQSDEARLLRRAASAELDGVRERIPDQWTFERIRTSIGALGVPPVGRSTDDR